MFDFAIASSRKKKPSRRLYISWIASCIAHGLMLLVLYQFPQLLQGGKYHRFQPAIFFKELLSTKPTDELKDQRVVTVLRPMMAPSDATLKKYLYDWDKKEGSAPPVQLKWGKEQLKAILNETKPPAPKPSQEPKPPQPPPAVNEAAKNNAAAPASGPAGGGASDSSSSGTSVVSVQNDPTTRKATVNLPPPAPAGPGKGEAATNNAPNNPPSSVPNSVKPPSNTTADASKAPVMKSFENEQQALRSREEGVIGANGYPIMDYVNMVKERIKGNWSIPSNLRNSQGHTTVIFFIAKAKDGHFHFTDARIVGSSGSNSLDLTALNAIIESDPAPPLPKGYPGDRIGAKFIFSYNEPQSQ